MCDSHQPLEGADSEDRDPNPGEGASSRSSLTPERRAEDRPLRVPEWRRRAMEAHQQHPWEAVTDLSEFATAQTKVAG